MKTSKEILKEESDIFVDRKVRKAHKWIGDKNFSLELYRKNCSDTYRKEFMTEYDNTIKSRIAKRFRDADLVNCPKTIQDYFTEENYKTKGLFIFGKVGTGKTYNAYALVKYLLAKSLNARIVNLPSLLNIIRASFSKQEVFDSNGDCESRFVKNMSDIEKLINTHILVIDDIGAEKPSEWVAETLYYLINSRYENEKTTIFTSNLSLDELSDVIGDRIASRINEMCDIVEMDGDDKRFKIK